MFLLRLIHLKGFKPKDEPEQLDNELTNEKKNNKKNIPPQVLNKDTVNQIKNISQEKKIKSEPKIETKVSIKSISELINLCFNKKEMKLKYELEKNVNLVKFENGRIEISFNENLDKEFVKNLSAKLLEWTNQKGIISISKIQG